MGQRIKYLLLCVAVSIFLLCGCERNNVPENLTYSEYEGKVQKSGYYLNFEYVEYEGIAYYFEADKYDNNQRREVIADVSRVLGILQTDENVLPDKFSVYFGEGLNQQGVYGKAFYDTAFDSSLDDIIILLQGIYGEYANYGLIYGYADYMMKQLKLKPLECYGSEVVAEYLNSMDAVTISEILDLNMPLFKEAYADEELSKISRSIAVSFVEYLIREYGAAELNSLLISSYALDTSFDKAYCNRINEWAMNVLGLECNKEPYSYAIRFERNVGMDREKYPYIVHSASTISYINSYMQVLWFESKTMGAELFDYHKMVVYFNYLEEDIEVAKEYLSPWFDIKADRLKMFFYMPGEYDVIYKSGYNSFNNTATIVSLSSGLHEYVHYLTARDDGKEWMVEGLAVYMDIYQQNGRSSLVSETPQWVYCAGDYEVIRNGAGAEEEEYTKAYNAYVNLTQNDTSEENIKYDLEAFYERAAYMECLGYEGYGIHGENVQMKMSYERAGSLINYMIKTYGEDKVFEVYKDYSLLDEVLGCSYGELLDAWELDLISRCE